MNSPRYILSIDQGTSSTKTLIFDEAGIAVAKGSATLHTSYTNNGFAEQDAEDIFQNVLASVKKCLDSFTENGFDVNNIVSIGITNQRETFLLWDEKGRPLYPAVVWQCKRSVEICLRLKEQGYEEIIRSKTGLLPDPYFSATKVQWLCENNSEINNAVKAGNVFFGTVDTWLLYKLTGNYCTDYTNASRTLLFNLHTLSWDEELLDIFGLNGLRLPEVKPSSFAFGSTNINGLLPAQLPINALIGDSHAAAFGEACFEPGTAKATMGTGCSVLMNTGEKPVHSSNGMVTTICWSTRHQICYALEGVIVSCGAGIEWMRNELGIFTESSECEQMATSVPDNNGVYIVPAFSGLGSPYWNMEVKACVSGLTFSSNKNHLVRAGLESVAYQLKDVILAMEADTGTGLKKLMTDGGISSNGFVMQFLADQLQSEIVYAGFADVSALGAAYLAGLEAGVYKDMEQLRSFTSGKNSILPKPANDEMKRNYEGWKKAVEQLLK